MLTCIPCIVLQCMYGEIAKERRGKGQIYFRHTSTPTFQKSTFDVQFISKDDLESMIYGWLSRLGLSVLVPFLKVCCSVVLIRIFLVCIYSTNKIVVWGRGRGLHNVMKGVKAHIPVCATFQNSGNQAHTVTAAVLLSERLQASSLNSRLLENVRGG
jgi:hypothetical protein